MPYNALDSGFGQNCFLSLITPKAQVREKSQQREEAFLTRCVSVNVTWVVQYARVCLSECMYACDREN